MCCESYGSRPSNFLGKWGPMWKKWQLWHL